MKKTVLILIIAIAVLGAILLPGLLGGKGANEPADPASAETEPETLSEVTPEPVYVSDPIYGDDITEEELEQLREEDAADNGVETFVVGEEFVIELGETQGTGGF